jgi:hypothetical protein
VATFIEDGHIQGLNSKLEDQLQLELHGARCSQRIHSGTEPEAQEVSRRTVELSAGRSVWRSYLPVEYVAEGDGRSVEVREIKNIEE